MASLRIAPINHVDSATLTASSEVATLPATNLQLTPRSKVWRSTSLAAQTISGTWGGAGRKPNCFGLFRHNGHGGSIRLQLYSDTALTAQVYDSGTVDIFTLVALGDFEWGVDPLGLSSTDLLGGEAPYVLFFTAVSCAGFKVTLSGSGGSGDAYWEIGRLWLGTYVEMTYNAAEAALGWREDSELYRSRGGSPYTLDGERYRVMELQLQNIATGDRPKLMDIAAQCGKRLDLLVSVFPTYGGRDERDYTLDAKSPNWDVITRDNVVRASRLAFEEL